MPTEVWASDAIAAGPSAIQGCGAFAVRDLASGTVIGRLGGRVVTTSERDALLAARVDDPSLPYVDTVAVGPDAHLVLPPGTPLHHLNHACDPNVDVDLATGVLVVRRPVGAGEELTTDYGPLSDPDAPRAPCRCGGRGCRGAFP